MASPTFAPDRREIWYSDGYNGFFAVKVTNEAWKDSKQGGRKGRCRHSDDDCRRGGHEPNTDGTSSEPK
jgi:hypothetical protein